MNVELNGLAANLDGSPRDVDTQLAALDELLALAREMWRRRAPKESADSAPELADRERLGDVVVRAELQAENLVELLAASREHDDRDVALAAQPLADLEPVEARQHHVENDEVDRLLVELPKRLLAVASLDDGVPVPLERIGEQGLDRFLVVDEEDCRSGSRHRRGREDRRPSARLL